MSISQHGLTEFIPDSLFWGRAVQAGCVQPHSALEGAPPLSLANQCGRGVVPMGELGAGLPWASLPSLPLAVPVLLPEGH